MALVDKHDIGSNQEGVDGSTLKNTPVDNGDYYTFNGSDNGLYWSSDWGDETTIDIKAKFRLHDKDKGSAQVIWKSGGNAKSIAIGIDASGNLGIFARSSSSLTSIVFDSSSYSNDVWYYLYATRYWIILQEVDNLGTYVEEEVSITPANGIDAESIGFARVGCPISGVGSDTSYFDGDIDYIELYELGTLEFINPLQYYFEGYVYELGLPVSRKLFLHRRSDGTLEYSTTSSGNGYYYMTTTNSGAHYIVCLDDIAGESYNDLIIGNVYPEEV